MLIYYHHVPQFFPNCLIFFIYSLILFYLLKTFGSKFHFSEVHGSRRHVNFAWDPLHSYFHELRKMKIIFYKIILCLYIVFVHYLWNFYLNFANKQ